MTGFINTESNTQSYIIQMPKNKSKLTFTPGFIIYLPYKKPNLIWRIFQYAFFGFKWEDC